MTTRSPSGRPAAPNGPSRWTVAICALIGLGVGLVAFAFRTPTYEAQTLVAISNPVGPLADEIDVVTSSGVLATASALIGFEPEVTVTSAEVAGLLTITAQGDNPEQAAAAANAVAATYVQAQLGAAANIAQVAEPPTSATGLGPSIYAAIGTILGALVGTVVAYGQRLLPGGSATLDPAGSAEPNQMPTSATPPAGLMAQGRVDTTSSPPSQQPVVSMDSRPSSFSDAMATVPKEPADETRAPRESPSAPQATPQAAPPQPNWLEQQPVAAPQEATPQAAPPQPNWLAQQPDAAPQEATPQATPPQPNWLEQQPDAASEDVVEAPALTEPDEPTPATEFDDLDRRALQSQHESARFELALAHDEQIARLKAENERQTVELRSEIANLKKQARMQAVRLNNRSGNDRTRVGDLEAQVDALETELTKLRQSLERERIANTKRITEERGSADRALDNARREYREELGKHVHAHRQALADYRTELDTELAADRERHAAALDEQHKEYERQLIAERERADAKLTASGERLQGEIQRRQAATTEALDRQAAQLKNTIESLRSAGEASESQLRELERENRLLRAEISSQQSQGRHSEADHAALVQRLNDEISLMKSELEAEGQRNAALRADVLRRSAEAHQAIDRAVEERTAQLAELESSVARQRQYADTRVREISAAAEEQARQASAREAGLTASISRLKRELEELKKAQNPA